MKNYSDEVTEDARLRILQSLAAEGKYTLNQAALDRALSTRYGHRLSHDRLSTELAWLDENKLLVVKPVGMTAVISLSLRGLDVTRDRAHVPGVARPQPGE